MKLFKTSCTILLILGLVGVFGCDFTKKSDDTAGDGGKVEEEEGKSKVSDDVVFESDDEEEKPIESANSGSRSTVVKFRKGGTSRTYENAVIRGETHTYTLGAAKGQTMLINITSTEDNAVFRVQTPGGQYLGTTSEEDGTKNFSDTLPANGNYKITVSPTRGNATFKITFTVKGGGSSEEEPEESPASGGKTTVVRFRKGGTSASYSNAVIRGERDTYILGASGGQLMSVSISSTENNAVFDVIGANGRTLVSESRGWSGQLPADGKNRIIVGGTRGNATYKISFSVK